MSGMINVALPKGRLGDKAYAVLERAGYPCPAMKEDNRRLTFENEELGVRYFLVKPSDDLRRARCGGYRHLRQGHPARAAAGRL